MAGTIPACARRESSAAKNPYLWLEMGQNQLLEDRAINLLNARFPEDSRPKRRCSLVGRGARLLAKELKMNASEARALAEIWADREELIIDREPYEIIAMLQAEAGKAKKSKGMIYMVIGVFAVIVILSIVFGDASHLASFGGIFAAVGGAAVIGGRSQIAMRYPEKLRRPEAVIPLAQAYLASDRAGRAAALSSFQGALESCAEAEVLDPEVLAEVHRLARKGPDDEVKAAAARALAAIQSRTLIAPAEEIRQQDAESLRENA